MPYNSLISVPSQTPGVSPVLAGHWNDYVKDNFELLRYGHLVFASATARNQGVTDSPNGMMAYLLDTNALSVLDSNGSWREAVNTASIVDLAVTTGKINNLAVTTGKIDNLAVTTAKIDDNAVTQAKMADNSVGTVEIVASAVTYPKLGDDTKTYSVNNSITAGKYYTSTGYLTSNSLSRQSTQNPLVIANSVNNISLQIPWNLGNIGDTITIVRMGSGSVEIVCMADGPNGALSIFQDSQVVADITQQYGIVTLICIGTVATPFPTEGGLGGNTWLITGDYAF